MIKLYWCSTTPGRVVAISDSIGNPLTFRIRRKWFTGTVIDAETKELTPCYQSWIKPAGEIKQSEYEKENSSQ